MKKLPTTKAEFTKYLEVWFDRVQAWLEHPAGIEEQEFYDCAELLNEASMIARKLGAGHLADTRRGMIAHEDLLDVLGRLLAWSKEGDVASTADDGRPLTVKQAAAFLNCSDDLIYDLCSSGQLVHHRIGKGKGTIRIPRNALSDLSAVSMRERRVDGNALFARHAKERRQSAKQGVRH